MVIDEVESQQPVAWFPQRLGHITTHPSGRTWAGAVENRLHVISLEEGLLPTE